MEYLPGGASSLPDRGRPVLVERLSPPIRTNYPQGIGAQVNGRFHSVTPVVRVPFPPAIRRGYVPVYTIPPDADPGWSPFALASMADSAAKGLNPQLLFGLGWNGRPTPELSTICDAQIGNLCMKRMARWHRGMDSFVPLCGSGS
jgi:hypothetical protein